MAERITINRPPSLDRVMAAIGRLARHEHFGDRMTGEEAHRVAAILCAANWAMRQDLLGASWRGHRHIAAKCGEMFDRLTSDEVYSRSNFQIEVDITFKRSAA